MAFNGAGVYNPIVAPDFPAVAGTTIRADQYNNQITDIATALTNCVTRDGQSPLNTNLPMGGFKLTGLGAGINPSDSVNLQQVQNNAMNWLGTSSGAANALSFGISPGISSFTAGQFFEGIIGTTNTGPATISIGGLAAVSLKKRALSGLSDLSANDLVAETVHQFMFDGTFMQVLTISPLSALYPVGSLYLNSQVSTNPATLLGFGTWVAFGTGRALVGIDPANPLMDTVGEVFGQANTTLPVHGHAVNDPGHDHLTNALGLVSPTINWTGTNGGVARTANDTRTSAAATGISIANSGSDPTNTNYQPSIAVYIWTRTA